MGDSDTDSSADSEGLEEGEEPSSLTFRTDGGWLKRFFDSAFFCEWIAVTYLFKHQSGGVRDYLCDRMYSLPLEGVQDYLFQICYLAVHKPSPSLEKYTTDVCSQSLHSFLRVYWFLSAELADRPNDLSVASIQSRSYEATMQGVVPSLRCPRPPRVSFFGRQNVFQLMSSASRRLLPLPSASPSATHTFDGKNPILAVAPSYVWGREAQQPASNELPPPKSADSVPSLEDDPSTETSLKSEPSDVVVTHESTFWRFLRERRLGTPTTDSNQSRSDNNTGWSFLGGRREAVSTIVGDLGAVTEADETHAEDGESGACSPSLNQGRRNSGGEARKAGVMRRLFALDGNGVETLQVADKNDTFFQRIFGEPSERAGPSLLDGSTKTSSAAESRETAVDDCFCVEAGVVTAADTSTAFVGGSGQGLVEEEIGAASDATFEQSPSQSSTEADSVGRPVFKDKLTTDLTQTDGGEGESADGENSLLKWMSWKRSGGMSKEAVTLIGGDKHRKESQSKENVGSEHVGLLGHILHKKTECVDSVNDAVVSGCPEEQSEGVQQKDMQQHQEKAGPSSSSTVLKVLVATAADAASGVVATAAGAAGVVANAAGAASGVVVSAAGAASGVAATVAGAATGARLLVGEAASQAVSMVPKNALRRKASQDVSSTVFRPEPELGTGQDDVSLEHMASPEHGLHHVIQVPRSDTSSSQASPAQLADSLKKGACAAVEGSHGQDKRAVVKASPGFMRRLFKDRPEEEPKDPSFLNLNAAATTSPGGSHIPVVDAPLPQKTSALRSLFSTPTFFASGVTKAKDMAAEGGQEAPQSIAEQIASRVGSLRSLSGGWNPEHAPSTCHEPAADCGAADHQPFKGAVVEADVQPQAAEPAATLEPLEASDSDVRLSSAGVDDASLLTAGVVIEQARPSSSPQKQPAASPSPWSLRAEGLFSALKGGARSSSNQAETPLGRGEKEGVSIVDSGASASPQTEDSLEGLYGGPKLPKHPSFSIRKSTVLATLDFVKALGDISFGLVDVFPNEDRQTALRESLAELNAHLAGMLANEGVFFPMGKGCFRVVRLLEDEAMLMSSRDRVPFMLLLEVLNCLPLSARKASTAHEGMKPTKTGIPLAASQPLPMRPPPWALHMWSQARPASHSAQDAPLGLSRTLSDVALDRAMASMYSRMRLVQVGLDVCRRPLFASAAAAAPPPAAAAPCGACTTGIQGEGQQTAAGGATLVGAAGSSSPCAGSSPVTSSSDMEKGGHAGDAEWEEHVSVRLVAVPGVTLDDLTGLDAVSLSRGRARVPSSLAIAHVRAVTHQGEGPPPGLPVTSPSSGVGPAQEMLGKHSLEENWESRKARIRQSSKFGTSPDWDLRSVIVKSGDDCRQEHFALQLVTHLSDIFQESGLPLWLRPYEILVTSGSTALIETITDAVSLHALKSRNPHITSLRQYFCEKFKHGSPEFCMAQQNFVESMAAYSVVCYLLQLKDRHNGNILLDDQGHIIHIDYGFMLSNSPGSVNFETAPFKLTREMVEVMDSDADGSPSEAFDYFKVLCIQGFLTSRKHAERILLLVEMMQQTRCPCFKAGQRVLHNLRKRFHLTLTEEQCVSLILSFISKSVDAWSTRQYDYYQRVLNGIL